MSKAHILGPGEGDLLTFKGLATRIKVRTEMTNEGLTVIETRVEPHFEGFSLHKHEHIKEIFYVLEGTLTIQLDNERITAKPGALILVPPGVMHTYWNESDEPAKYLLMITPGGFEKYLEGLTEMMRASSDWANADKTALYELAKKYDVTAQN
jgi:quercetin dioxygenase-like cupin family protein